MTTTAEVMGIGERMKQLRAAADLTQQDVAQRGGLALSAVAQLEQGTATDPRMTTLLRIAKGLGVTLTELMDGVSEEPPRPKRRPRKPEE
jgi:transcriptional regulator with XRE-family HTH domain